MALELPKSRGFRTIQTQKPNVPLDQIIAVQGQSPVATGIDTAGKLIGQALTRQAELKRQGQQIAYLAQMQGEPAPDFSNGMSAVTPDVYEKGIGLKTARAAKRAEAAKQRVELELKMEERRRGYVERDANGVERHYPGVQGLNLKYDAEGNPFIERDPSYKPGEIPKSAGSGNGSGGESKVFIGNDADGNPLLLGNKSGAISVGRVPSGGSVMPKTQPATIQKDVKDMDDQLQQVDDLRKMLNTVPGGLVGGIESGLSKITQGNIGAKQKQYNDLKPSIATRIYRAMTGDTRLSDADAAGRAYPLLPTLSEPLNVRESKLQNIEKIIRERKQNLLSGGGYKSPGGLQPLPVPRASQAPGPMKVGRFHVEVEQ